MFIWCRLHKYFISYSYKFKFSFILNVAVGGGFFADGCVNKYINSKFLWYFYINPLKLIFDIIIYY